MNNEVIDIPIPSVKAYRVDWIRNDIVEISVSWHHGDLDFHTFEDAKQSLLLHTRMAIKAAKRRMKEVKKELADEQEIEQKVKAQTEARKDG